MVQTVGRGYEMAVRGVLAAIAMAALLAGCAGSKDTTCKCPTIVAYDDATLEKITQALKALPSDSVLHQAMDDYENERDDLRFCR